jgi:hypothetical protein
MQVRMTREELATAAAEWVGRGFRSDERHAVDVEIHQGGRGATVTLTVIPDPVAVIEDALEKLAEPTTQELEELVDEELAEEEADKAEELDNE